MSSALSEALSREAHALRQSGLLLDGDDLALLESLRAEAARLGSSRRAARASMEYTSPRHSASASSAAAAAADAFTPPSRRAQPLSVASEVAEADEDANADADEEEEEGESHSASSSPTRERAASNGGGAAFFAASAPVSPHRSSTGDTTRVESDAADEQKQHQSHPPQQQLVVSTPHRREPRSRAPSAFELALQPLRNRTAANAHTVLKGTLRRTSLDLTASILTLQRGLNSERSKNHRLVEQKALLESSATIAARDVKTSRLRAEELEADLRAANAELAEAKRYITAFETKFGQGESAAAAGDGSNDLMLARKRTAELQAALVASQAETDRVRKQLASLTKAAEDREDFVRVLQRSLRVRVNDLRAEVVASSASSFPSALTASPARKGKPADFVFSSPSSSPSRSKKADLLEGIAARPVAALCVTKYTLVDLAARAMRRENEAKALQAQRELAETRQELEGKLQEAAQQIAAQRDEFQKELEQSAAAFDARQIVLDQQATDQEAERQASHAAKEALLIQKAREIESACTGRIERMRSEAKSRVDQAQGELDTLTSEREGLLDHIEQSAVRLAEAERVLEEERSLHAARTREAADEAEADLQRANEETTLWQAQARELERIIGDLTHQLQATTASQQGAQESTVALNALRSAHAALGSELDQARARVVELQAQVAGQVGLQERARKLENERSRAAQAAILKACEVPASSVAAPAGLRNEETHTPSRTQPLSRAGDHQLTASELATPDASQSMFAPAAQHRPVKSTAQATDPVRLSKNAPSPSIDVPAAAFVGRSDEAGVSKDSLSLHSGELHALQSKLAAFEQEHDAFADRLAERDAEKHALRQRIEELSSSVSHSSRGGGGTEMHSPDSHALEREVRLLRASEHDRLQAHEHQLALAQQTTDEALSLASRAQALRAGAEEREVQARLECQRVRAEGERILNQECERLESMLHAESKALAGLHRSLDAERAQSAAHLARVRGLEDAVEAVKASATSSHAELLRAREECRALEGSVDAGRKKLAEANAQLDHYRSTFATLEAQLDEYKSSQAESSQRLELQLHASQTRLAEAESALSRTSAELHSARQVASSDRVAASQTIQSLRDDVFACEKSMAELDARARAAENQAGEARRAAAEASGQLEVMAKKHALCSDALREREHSLSSLQARLQVAQRSLDAEQAKRRGFEEGVLAASTAATSARSTAVGGRSKSLAFDSGSADADCDARRRRDEDLSYVLDSGFASPPRHATIMASRFAPHSPPTASFAPPQPLAAARSVNRIDERLKQISATFAQLKSNKL